MWGPVQWAALQPPLAGEVTPLLGPGAQELNSDSRVTVAATGPETTLVEIALFLNFKILFCCPFPTFEEVV